MAMDWSAYGGYTAPTLGDDIEDDEDFYGSEQDQNHTNGNDHMQTAAGAPAHAMSSANMATVSGVTQPNNNAPVTPSPEEQKKIEQQKQLEALRKKLLAKRGAIGRPDTPSKVSTSSDPPHEQHKVKQKENKVDQPIPDDFGIESLLAEGKAAAEAKVARDNQAAAAAIAAAVNEPSNTAHQPVAARTIANKEVGQVKPASTREKPAEPTQPVASPPKPTDTRQSNTDTTSHPVNMSDPYYDDLAIWLEFTGYHDVQFRTNKLSTFKERRELEQEAARIAARLEKLKQAERADLESLRATTAHYTAATPMEPPPLPTNMPTGEPRYNTSTNSLKRLRSPEPSTTEKSSRRNNDTFGDFRIRGANEANSAVSRDNGSPLQRRESLPERRRSMVDRQERDPSLERRQQQYNTRDAHTPRANGRSTNSTWTSLREGPRPFNARDRERDGRTGFSAVNRIGGPQHGGNASLDLRKGGVRYFMIKSWNHDNVAQAMKDGLWATQEKNETLLTEAFHTSRHVILLFSVNRSMAFQGYALMTSPPDPALPTPTFCSKLNWATSPAFSLRWLATTPVHFRLVGHLKNTCNPDEEGLPRAVLVGKDGQEISQDAGLGVVEILDEAMEVEGRGRLREDRD